MKSSVKNKKSHGKKSPPTSPMDQLQKLAWESLENSYSPYSKFKVGSAILLENGKMYGGCNIENASYGGTVCAERVAIWKALSEGEKSKIKFVYVVTSATQPWPPCGFCRQVIIEFSTRTTQVICEGKNGVQHHYLMDELLPEAFVPSSLRK